MKQYMNKALKMVCFAALAASFAACSDFFEQESDHVIYADHNHLNNATDTIYSVTGIMNKLQAIGDRTILLGELRGDLVDVSSYASSDLRDVALFNIGDDNEYNNPTDYYAIINNCNYFIAYADTALKNNRNEYIFRKEYAAVKAYRAWTYLQLALNYGSVPFVTEPILSKAASEADYPKYNIEQICNYFISDLAPYATVEYPSYGNIRSHDSRFFYFPIYILLGELNLWAGNYKEAALNYYKYISTRNGTNSSYPISLSQRVRFTNNKWMRPSGMTTVYEDYTAAAELITYIPGDSIPSEGNYSQLRNIFCSTTDNNYEASVLASQALIDLSASQNYCTLNNDAVVYAPKGNTFENYLDGDLRLYGTYEVSKNRTTASGATVDMISNNKYRFGGSPNVHIYRRALVYLHMAEALNRAGYPRFAFEILKNGVNNQQIEKNVIPYYQEDSVWIRQFDFPNTSYEIVVPSVYDSQGSATYNTMGIHSRGSGWASLDTLYVMPDDSTLTGSARLDYQIEAVEDLILDEDALEMSFEGYRFYDLMRVALRRGDPSYLANKIYARRGADNEATMRSLITVDLTDTRNWYMNWNDKIGLGY